MTTAINIKGIVRDAYANIARTSGACGCVVQKQSGQMGYSEADLGNAPAGSNLGLGCGNPVAIASLKVGEVVLDLGSGAGFDVFLAAI